jgi:hypothetical protein
MATGDVAAHERATRSEPSPSGRMEEDVVELQQGDDAAEEPEPKRLRRSERRKSQDGGGVVQEPAVDAVDLTGDTDDDDEVEVVRIEDSPPRQPAVESGSIKCAICMDAVGKRDLASTICGHIFCHDCIVASMRTSKKCPTCRKSLRATQVHRLFV